MYLQQDFEQLTCQFEADKADLQRKLSSAATKYEELEHQCDLTQKKLTDLECLNGNLDLRNSNLQATCDALRAQLEQVETSESAATKKVASLKSQMFRRQIIGSCGSD
jgi:chromosome segregation ATPase